jgi:hypothetical protein
MEKELRPSRYACAMNAFICVRHACMYYKSAMGEPRPMTLATPAARSAAVLAQVLRRAISAASASPTLQEGLYRVYLSDLWHLTRFDDGQSALQLELRAAITDLRTRLGFDEATGTKIAPSTLDSSCATAILTRLEILAVRSEAFVAEHDESAEP